MTTKDTKDPKDAGGTAVAEQDQTQAAASAASQESQQLVKPAAPPEKEIAKVPIRMGLAPNSLEEAWRMATFMAASEIVPKIYQKKPNDILVGIQYGMELGFAPMQALQSIAVINGRPSVWGDGFLALIMSSSLYADHDEYYEVDGERRDYLTAADMEKDSTAAVTTFVRVGKATPVSRRFSVGQSRKAGLWKKDGPWQTYPDRMLKMRARSWAGRDAFPDLLRGIHTAEEARDLPPTDTIDLEPAKEVRRMSETASGPAATPVHEKPSGATDEIQIGPVAVKDVEQFLGGYTITLSDGQKVDTVEASEALDLEKMKGTKHQIRLVCVRAGDDGKLLQLKSFGIAD